MKKILIFFMMGIIASHSLKAQCDVRMYDIYTPIGSPVVTFLMCESSTQTRQGYDDYFAQAYPNAELMSTYNGFSSTRKFNCHGYAWLRVEQGIDRWIGTGWINDITDPEQIYMTDGSYTQVSQATYPGKVSWGSGDHSAVTTAQSGVLISKWNEYPLMRHAWGDSPYGTNNLKYYVRTPIITGPTSVCPGTTGTFTVNNAPANTNITWSCSNPSAITPNGNPATVTNNTNLNNSGMSFVPFVIPPIVNYYPEWWIHAELAGTGITLEKTITVNTNRVEDFDLPATASANTILIVTATTAVPGIVNWSVTPSTGVNWQQWSNNSMQITFSQSGLYTVQASTTTACGTFTKEKQITISGGCSTCPPIQLYVIAYPNPSSDLLNIEVREEIKGESSRVISKERKPVFLYQLFDEKGNSVLRTETSDKKIQFNTSKLSNGIYFIHLQDISSKDSGPAKQTVIIRH